MKRCKDCKYFERNKTVDNWGNDKYGSCNCEKFVYGGSYDEKLVKGTDQLMYEDYEGYNASFEVGEDFGCVHFEERRGEYE